MDKRIFELMKKCGVDWFNFYAEDLFTYVLETRMPVNKAVIDEIKNTLAGAEIKNTLAGAEIKNIIINPFLHQPVHPVSTDMVAHPAHYNTGRIEVIEAIEDWKVDFHTGNAIKYVARAGRKNPDKEVEDLEKAVWYIRRKVELLKSKKDNRVAVRPNDMVKQ